MRGNVRRPANFAQTCNVAKARPGCSIAARLSKICLGWKLSVPGLAQVFSAWWDSRVTGGLGALVTTVRWRTCCCCDSLIGSGLLVGAHCWSGMAAISVTPAWLEMSEGPTELVKLYVWLKGQDGQMHKGKVVSCDGPSCGYTMRLLGKRQLLRGISATNMEFLPNQEEISSRLVSSEDVPIAQLVKGHRKRKPMHGAVLGMGDGGVGRPSNLRKRPSLAPKTDIEQHTCKRCGRSSSRVKDTGSGLLCGICQLRTAAETFSEADNAHVCQEVSRRQQIKLSAVPEPSPEVRHSKRECPASIILGVYPFWQGDFLFCKKSEYSTWVSLTSMGSI
jgi:transcription elongation factor Elf1